MTVASIQRIEPGGKAEILVTEVEGIKLNGPNDLVFAPDGTLVFTDPGTYNPADPDPSYIFALRPTAALNVLVAFREADFSERRGRRGRRLDRVGRILYRACAPAALRRNDRGPRPHARRKSRSSTA